MKLKTFLKTGGGRSGVRERLRVKISLVAAGFIPHGFHCRQVTPVTNKNTMVGEGGCLAAGRERVVAVFGIDLQTGPAHFPPNFMVRPARGRPGHLSQAVLVAVTAGDS